MTENIRRICLEKWNTWNPRQRTLSVLIVALAVLSALLLVGRALGGPGRVRAGENERAESASAETGKEQTGQDGESYAVPAAEMEEILAVEAAIQPGRYPIMGASSITWQQMAAYFNASGRTYPSEELEKGGAADIESFCRIYYEEAAAEGVRPEVAFAQTMKETGYLQFGGDAQIEQFNFAGLGTTGGGVPGNSFPDVRTGVRAQIQHLKAYATDAALEKDCVDSRYEYVAKGSAPYVEWLGQQENPEGLGWATGENYGYDIVEMITAMRALD